MEFFDSHAHYNDERFDEDKEDVLNKLYREEDITRIVCCGYNVEKSKKAIEIAKGYDFIYATAGISPNDLEDYSKESLMQIEEMLKQPKVVAVRRNRARLLLE